jgi:hypothetical protein
VQQVVRAATLERTDRVDRLDLQDHLHTEPLAEGLADVLGRIAKDGVDQGRGFANPFVSDGGVHGRWSLLRLQNPRVCTLALNSGRANPLVCTPWRWEGEPATGPPHKADAC